MAEKDDQPIEDAEVIKPLQSGSEPRPEDHIVIPARFVFPKVLTMLPLPNRPVFPGMVVPLTVDEHYQPLVREIVEKKSRFVGLLLRRKRDPGGESPRPAQADDFYDIGTIAEIAQVERPEAEGSMQVVVAALGRFKIEHVLSEQPYVRAEVKHIPEPEMESNNELKAYAQSILSSLKELLNLNPLFKEELRLFLSHSSLNDPGRLADFAAALTTADGKELQQILETFNIRERIEKSLTLLTREVDISKLKVHINKQIEDKLTKQQREFFLREQLKMIKKELGIEKEGKETELDRFHKRLEGLQLSEEARKRVDEELEKLGVMEPASPEYAVSRNYLDWITSLPWGIDSKDSLDIKKARETLDANHYGLDDVKERILEFLSVGILKEKMAGTIICLIGPPGVGKTSIGQAIAQSVGRKFYRFSLGGMKDEAEINGHRRTYIGAMPGKFIQALKVCGTRNPVIMLDEVDKIGASFQGDPASALLEVLDPEQNRDFLDHYLDVRFDLSQVMFICTANQSDTIPPPLLDRMEIINLSGYVLEEKLQIAKKHIIPRQLKEHGLTPARITLRDSAIREIIDGYARDPGVRSMENGVRKIFRKVAKNIVSGSTNKADVTKDTVAAYLGKRQFNDTDPFSQRRPGIVMGLAWTSMGGATLYVEATRIPSRTPGFKQTGQLGKVMVESSEIAFSVVRGKLGPLEAYKTFFEEHLVHLHVPAGATPKDGPSAGITMATALYSMVTGKIIRRRLAMTGELSLTGLVMPIGGLKEKTIAARRAGVKTLIFPNENKKDFDELPEHIRKGLDPHFVGTFDEVIALCFA